MARLRIYNDLEIRTVFVLSHVESPYSSFQARYDNATPSGNGVAASALNRLGQLIGGYRYCQAAENTIKLFYTEMSQQHPSNYCSLLVALEDILIPSQTIVLRGDKANFVKWQYYLQVFDIPVLFVPSELICLLLGLNKPVPSDPSGDDVSAWVCQNSECLPEISTP